MKLHLGCGSNVFEDWTNLDVDPSFDSGVVKWTAPYLPFDDGSIDFIYSEHFIEHISVEEAHIFFRECYRALKPAGVMRVSTPDLYQIVLDYQNHNVTELNKKYGILNGTITSRCGFVNQAMRDWGHKYIYDMSELISLAVYGGFDGDNMEKSWYKDSAHAPLRNLETRPDYGDLIMEFEK